jgi:hypothetical protein
MPQNKPVTNKNNTRISRNNNEEEKEEIYKIC